MEPITADLTLRLVLTAGLLLGFAPALVTRLLTLAWPRGHPRRRELRAELDAIDYWKRPLWVCELLEAAVVDGLRERLRPPNEADEEAVPLSAPVAPAPIPAPSADQRPAFALGVERSFRSYAPVLALTLMREVDGRAEVLVGVRTSHNGVLDNKLSVPTMRVLREVALGWAGPLSDGLLTRAGLRRKVSIERTVRHLVREIFALKLGMADALERGEVEFEIEAMTATQGATLLASREGEDITEDVTIFNALVRWTHGHNLLAERTVTYNPLLWISAEEFDRTLRPEHWVSGRPRDGLTRRNNSQAKRLDEILRPVRTARRRSVVSRVDTARSQHGSTSDPA